MQDKKVFVEDTLAQAVRTANPSVNSLTYTYINGAEFVNIIMNNGSRYNVDVTADSMIAIMYDASKVMKSK